MVVSRKWEIPSTTRMNPSSFAKRKTLCFMVMAVEFDAVMWLAFPCLTGTPMCRTASCISELPIEVSKLDPGLPIIQISSLCGGKGSAGALVFNSEGLIIEIYSFRWKSFSFTIHFDAVRTFVEAHVPHVLRNGGSTSHAAVSDDDEGGHLISFDHF